ncbi:tyrosine recombinase [Mobilitalea sibirica]|uniref:Tyrosine recombinase n=1 Tax=Mobilitalea sibirica TaxID=1462919 RepID=A0A8J7H8C0_9FIRM|nr:tyrosine recombinase [Mobilitalea sibirica]MBH1941476.1 tyrosine recombinase [Mobilitalea sibirica]
MEFYIGDFVTYLKEIKHASHNTVQAYQADLKRLESFLMKQNITTVHKISETCLNSYVLSLEKEGLSPASVSRNIASMKAFFLFLLKKGMINGDPSERIKPPKIVKKPPQTIQTDLIDKLLKQPDVKTKKGIRDKAMLELLYATGMKVTQLISIRLSDINLNGKYLTCRDKKERNIPFGKTAKEAIQQYLAIRQEEFNKQNSDLLFMNTSGEQLSRQGFWKILKGYANAVGIKNVNPNAIRHSFAAHLLENGADLVSVQEFLGHSDISTTQLYLNHSYKNSREVYLNTHPRA